MGMNVIITGASGMVGEGVALRCIASAQVEKILILGRRPSGITHPKVSELIVSDFLRIADHSEHLQGYDAMFFCAGVSSIGKNEEQYRAITYDVAMAVATLMVQLHPNMSFSYISGAGTDSTEQGKSMWARVKGKTENDIMALPFRQALAVRPGLLHPIPGSMHVNPYYKYIGWLYPLLRVIIRNHVSTLAELGDAMINAVHKAPARAVLEVPDIQRLAKS